MATQIWAVGLVVLATLVGSFGPILLKKGSSDFGFNLKKLFSNYNLIGGVFLYGLSTILFIPALRGGELSVLYPFVSLSYIWVSLLSIRFLSEKMNLLKWCGVFLIVMGVSLIGFGG